MKAHTFFTVRSLGIVLALFIVSFAMFTAFEVKADFPRGCVADEDGNMPADCFSYGDVNGNGRFDQNEVCITGCSNLGMDDGMACPFSSCFDPNSDAPMWDDYNGDGIFGDGEICVQNCSQLGLDDLQIGVCPPEGCYDPSSTVIIIGVPETPPITTLPGSIDAWNDLPNPNGTTGGSSTSPGAGDVCDYYDGQDGNDYASYSGASSATMSAAAGNCGDNASPIAACTAGGSASNPVAYIACGCNAGFTSSSSNPTNTTSGCSLPTELDTNVPPPGTPPPLTDLPEFVEEPATPPSQPPFPDWFWNGWGWSPPTDIVTTTPWTPGATVVNLEVSPTSMIAGNYGALYWTSSNAVSCEGTGFSTGGATENTTGVSTGRLVTTTTYSITCTGPGGTGVDTETINVSAALLPDLRPHGLLAVPIQSSLTMIFYATIENIGTAATGN